jgi:hypothetical protein
LNRLNRFHFEYRLREFLLESLNLKRRGVKRNFYLTCLAAHVIKLKQPTDMLIQRG